MTEAKPPEIPLVLKRLDWGDGTPLTDDDWSVWYGGEKVGRILLNPEYVSGHQWMWSITKSVPGYTVMPNNGLEATREDAMKAFRKRWDDASMADRLRRAGDRG